MKKVLSPNKTAGSSNQNEPRHIGELIMEFFRNFPSVAKALSELQENADATDYYDIGGPGDELFKDIHPNTELGVDLKLFSRSLGRMDIGEVRPGAITRDGEDHFTFFESAQDKKVAAACKRNPHILELNRINVNRKDDGTLYPTFNRPQYTEDFTFQDFCREAAEELLMVAGSFDNISPVKESQKGE